MDINYDIIGKGSDSSDPIKVTVDSHATSASICFRYQLAITHDCCTDIYCNNACENVSLTPNTSCTDVISNPITSITWANQLVYYQITQLPNSAFTPYDKISDIEITENNLEGSCGSVTKKIVPYSYNVITTVNECGSATTTPYIDTTEIILDCSTSDDDTSKIYDGSIVLSGENVTYKYKCKECTCEPNVTYCVDPTDIKVWYFQEDSLPSDCSCDLFYWVEDDTPCYDISTNILTSGTTAFKGTWKSEDDGGVLSINGGWLWLELTYTATTTSEDCSTSTRTTTTKPNSGRSCHGLVHINPSQNDCVCKQFFWGDYVIEDAVLGDATTEGCNEFKFKYKIQR